MTDQTIEQELLSLERRYWQALKDKDADTAAGLTDDQYILTGAQGVSRIDKSTFAAMMQGASWAIVDFDIGDDVQIRLLSDDSAVLAYTVHEALTVDGQRVAIDAADASAWVRRDGQWLCALHTESIAGDPFGRDRTTIV